MDEQEKDIISFSPSKLFRVIKTMDTYKREFRKKLEETHILPSTRKIINSTITKLNARMEVLNSILTHRGIDSLIDNYTKKLENIKIGDENDTKNNTI